MTYTAQPIPRRENTDTQAAKEREELKNVELGAVLETTSEFAVYCVEMF